jgi:hypothetical protein
MSANRRFEWDLLLEQEPEKPPIRTESTEPRIEPKSEPPEIILTDFEPEFDTIDTRDNYKVQQTVAIPEIKKPVKPERNRRTEHPRQTKYPAPKQQQQANSKQQGMNILEGNITHNQLVNAFILSEIFGKPKGMRRRR